MIRLKLGVFMKNIILDLDTGVDDSLALALAIADKNINLLGVTTTYGNVQTKRSCINSSFILNLLKQNNIPVLKGLDHALLKDTFKRNAISSKIHGKNGLGNIEEEFDSFDKNKYQDFISFVLNMIKKYDGDLSFVTTGPLTNVAYLLENYKNEITKINEVVSMGGAIIYPGNVSNNSEANIHQDPHAAKIVLESELKSVIVPLDVTQKARINHEDILIWNDKINKTSRIFYKMLTHYMRQHPNPDQCYIHDPSAVMYCINPSLFTTLDKDLTVLENKNDYGRIVGDLNKIRSTTPSSTICLDVKADELSSYILNTTTSYFKNL
jgi:purine nucleosidase